ncbi:MAG: zf-TFIIB domain-containing protein [Bacteroidota bacterium]
MDCPVCKKSMMVLELQQIEIDYCQGCDGIWLDAGELELLLEDTSEKKQLLDSFIVDPQNAEKPRRCPKCSKKMHKVHVGKNKDVLVDKCKKNHGIWFDEGELKQVVELGSVDKNNKVIELLNEMFAYKLKTK